MSGLILCLPFIALVAGVIITVVVFANMTFALNYLKSKLKHHCQKFRTNRFVKVGFAFEELFGQIVISGASKHVIMVVGPKLSQLQIRVAY